MCSEYDFKSIHEKLAKIIVAANKCKPYFGVVTVILGDEEFVI